MATDPELLWQPAHPEKAQASLFRNHINKKFNLNLDSYEDLWKWSCDNRGDYWSEVWDWEGVVGDKGAAPVSATSSGRSNVTVCDFSRGKTRQ